MYSYEDGVRAVELFIKLGRSFLRYAPTRLDYAMTRLINASWPFNAVVEIIGISGMG